SPVHLPGACPARRRVLRSSGSAFSGGSAMTWSRGIGSVLLAGLLVGLGPAAAITAAKPPAIQEGGTLVVGMVGSSPGSVDPENGGLSELYRSFCEPLYDTARDGTTVPDLASGMPIYSKDKLTITIPLRRGILFNDGTPFNAQAAVATFERDIRTGRTRASVLGFPTSASASGPYAVQL